MVINVIYIHIFILYIQYIPMHILYTHTYILREITKLLKVALLNSNEHSYRTDTEL